MTHLTGFGTKAMEHITYKDGYSGGTADARMKKIEEILPDTAGRTKCGPTA